MKKSVKALLAALWLTAGVAPAQATQQPQQTQQRQDPAVLRQVVEQFLRIQTAGLPGQVNLSVGQVDARSSLPACAAPEAFLPNGSRIWGRTTVGVRCTVPSPWTMYISATVQVVGEYIAAAVPLAQGQLLGY